ncbi:MAG: hypothetical protein HOP20_02180 [Sulfuriferula sp.]|nr:hypothetical protein [Sulfuriferula sp.]
MKTIVKVMALSVALGLSGCASQNTVADTQASETDFIAANYKAADQLLMLASPKLAKGSSVIMATLVNIDSLESSSTLGRGISEQVTTRFSQAGYNMIEMKFRGSVYMKRNEGELMLTREVSQLAKAQNANAVVVGTYARAGTNVFINLKIINPNTDTVIAATDYALPLNRDIKILLGDRAQGYSGY